MRCVCAMKIERAGDEANTGVESGRVKSQKETIFVGICKMYMYEGKKDDWEKFEPCRRRVSFSIFRGDGTRGARRDKRECY